MGDIWPIFSIDIVAYLSWQLACMVILSIVEVALVIDPAGSRGNGLGPGPVLNAHAFSVHVYLYL